MKKPLPRHNERDLHDDKFWRDVDRAYEDYVREGVTFSTEDVLWEAAKDLARFRYKIAHWVDRAKREGKTYEEIVIEEGTEERRRRKEQESN